MSGSIPNGLEGPRKQAVWGLAASPDRGVAEGRHAEWVHTGILAGLRKVTCFEVTMEAEEPISIHVEST
ncbi:hypothetical protein [Paludibaculum fermentans]|uniref:hypothetical protein n=1 Tax=Paludibaculum fermentans TaxID=1473598 RepID=UPI003EC1173D